MKYSQENICAECLLSCNFIKKEALAQGCFCEFCKIFRSRLFTEYIWMTASILQQLLALYFAVTYSWQLLSSEKALVGKKFIHISQHIYILIYFLFFCHFLWQMFVYLVSFRSSAVFWADNCFVDLETPKHNDFDQFWKFKLNLEHFPRNTRFLIFDRPSDYLYLFKNNRKTFSAPRERPLFHQKVTWSKQILFGTLLCRILLPGRHLLFEL